MLCKYQALFLVVSAWMGLSQSANILVIAPIAWKSHHFVFQTIIKALAEKGHQIDYLTPLPIKSPPPSVRNLVVNIYMDENSNQNAADMAGLWNPIAQSLFRSYINQMLAGVYGTEPAIKELLNSNKTYDLVMSELIFQEINAVWAHRFKAIPVCLMALGDVASVNDLNGLPDNPAYMVDYSGAVTDTMSFIERLRNCLDYVFSLPVHYYKAWELEKLADETLRYPGWEDRPPLTRLASDQALVLVNNHLAVSYAYPKAPHVKDIGGMTLTGSTELPEDLKSFMDDASEGVVYFSLGSIVDINKLTKGGKLQEFLAAFKSLKQKVLFKWAGDNMPVINDKKIRIAKWFPQLGVLAHNNTKVFISHGGLQSTMETIHFRVPVVSIPMFADQTKNSKFLMSAKCGVALDKRNLTKESLQWAINEVLYNSEYKKAVSKRSSILNDASMSHIDAAVYWIEYVLRHGRVLQPASLHMPFYQVYLLDVIAFVTFTILLSYFILLQSFKSCIYFLRSKFLTLKSKMD